MIEKAKLFPGGDKLAIIFCGGTQKHAPWNQPGWTFWSIPSNIYNFGGLGVCPHVWFDIHQEIIWREKKGWHKDYQGWLKQCPQPVVMLTTPKPDEVPSYVPYPLDEVNQEFGADAPIAGTMDWMVALALLYQPEVIGLFGCDYATAHEQVYQWFGIAYWLGLCRGRKQSYYLPPDSFILTGPLRGRYGLNFPPWPPGHHPDFGPWRHMGNLRGLGKLQPPDIYGSAEKVSG